MSVDLLSEPWVRQFPPTTLVAGRLRVALGPRLCAFDVPAVVGARVLATVKPDLCPVPTCELRNGLWVLFATPDQQLGAAKTHQLREAGVKMVDTGILDLPPPGECAWRVEFRHGGALPTRSHLAELVLHAQPR